ncbi:hypothetical protein LMIY3S_05566 [Labrys miyagiensis]
MKRALIAVGLVVAAGWALPGRAWTSSSELEVGSVTGVVVEGEAARIEISTDATAPYKAVMRGRTKGWFSFWYSSWSGSRCELAGAMTLSGSELLVNTGAQDWSLFDDDACNVELDVNLPPGARISIDQKATMSRLEGDFSALKVKSHAGDIALQGHAGEVDIEGNAVQARLDYDRVERNETIALSGNALNAELNFPPATAVDYQVTGNATLIDSEMASTPGARPRVRISGNFLRARIR